MSHLCYVCLQEGFTDLVECGVGQCKTLRKVTIRAIGHQKLTSSILKGMIQNPSLEQVKLWSCDFQGRFYNIMDLIFEDHILYTVISIEWLCSVKCLFQVISSQCIASQHFKTITHLF